VVNNYPKILKCVGIWQKKSFKKKRPMFSINQGNKHQPILISFITKLVYLNIDKGYNISVYVKKNVMANEIVGFVSLKYFPSPFALEGLSCSKSSSIMFASMLAHSLAHSIHYVYFCHYSTLAFLFFWGIHA
jgi:hypothetical protein